MHRTLLLVSTVIREELPLLGLHSAVNFLKPFMIPFLFFFLMQAFDDALDRGSTITWFANNLSALIRFSHRPCACALKTFA